MELLFCGEMGYLLSILRNPYIVGTVQQLLAIVGHEYLRMALVHVLITQRIAHASMNSSLLI